MGCSCGVFKLIEWSVLVRVHNCELIVQCREMRRDIATYTNDMQNAQRYKLAYKGVIYIIPNFSTWKELNALLFFSHLTREGQVGQIRLGKWVLKSQRTKNLMIKVAKIIKCSNYQEMSHNTYTCKNPHIPNVDEN